MREREPVIIMLRDLLGGDILVVEKMKENNGRTERCNSMILVTIERERERKKRFMIYYIYI